MTAPVAPSLAPVLDAVVAALTAGMRCPVGTVARPPGSSVPYAFISRTVQWTGTLGQPWASARVALQVTVVAYTPDDVEWLEGQARAALVAAPVVDGWDIARLSPDGGRGPMRDPDEDPARPIYFSTPEWSLWATPLEAS